MRKLFLATLICAPALLMAQQETKPATPTASAKTNSDAKVSDYLSADHFIKGANVKVGFPDDFQAKAKPIAEAVQKAPKDVVQEIQKTSKPDEPLPNDERLGIKKADYDAYIAGWNARKLVPVEEVAVRLDKLADGKMKILSAGAASNGGPLPLSCLEYDPKTDSWKSPNGTLVRKEDVDFGPNNLFGEWKGPQWVYEQKDIDGTVIENFAMGKSPKDKDIFLVYRIVELLPSGQVNFQNMYVIHMDGAQMKSDPLKEAAAAKAKAKKKK